MTMAMVLSSGVQGVRYGCLVPSGIVAPAKRARFKFAPVKVAPRIFASVKFAFAFTL